MNDKEFTEIFALEKGLRQEMVIQNLSINRKGSTIVDLINRTL